MNANEVLQAMLDNGDVADLVIRVALDEDEFNHELSERASVSTTEPWSDLSYVRACLLKEWLRPTPEDDVRKAIAAYLEIEREAVV